MGSIPVAAGPVNTVAPFAEVYEEDFEFLLTWDNGTWTGSPTSYSYELWNADDNTIWSYPSAPPEFAYFGFNVKIKVTATNGGGSTSVFSNTVAA
jgi:hypothetical protein